MGGGGGTKLIKDLEIIWNFPQLIDDQLDQTKMMSFIEALGKNINWRSEVKILQLKKITTRQIYITHF